jgi:hypothetical protein
MRSILISYSHLSLDFSCELFRSDLPMRIKCHTKTPNFVHVSLAVHLSSQLYITSFCALQDFTPCSNVTFTIKYIPFQRWRHSFRKDQVMFAMINWILTVRSFVGLLWCCNSLKQYSTRMYHLFWSRYNDGLRAERPRFDSRQDKIFLFSTASRPALGPTQPPVQWVPGVISLGIKWQER